MQLYILKYEVIDYQALKKHGSLMHIIRKTTTKKCKQNGKGIKEAQSKTKETVKLNDG